MLDNLCKNPNDKLDKEEIDYVLQAMEEMAEDHEEIKNSMAAIKLCIATVEDKEIIVIANVIVALLLTMPINVLEGFSKTIPDMISQKLKRELKNIINNCKKQDEDNE